MAANQLDGLLEDQVSTLPALAGNTQSAWKMFSYDHWSRQANADSTKQTSLAGGNEARGDGGSLRIR
jgi:hypothetical protein